MDDFQKQVQTLLDAAMKQPGVADVMRVYQTQESAIKAHALAQGAVAPKWVVSSSTSTQGRF